MSQSSVYPSSKLLFIITGDEFELQKKDRLFHNSTFPGCFSRHNNQARKVFKGYLMKKSFKRESFAKMKFMKLQKKGGI